MRKLVLLRHGESDWNRENRFTGWTDVDLSQQGTDEARAAGRLLKSEGYDFDCAYTSVLKRAIRTLWIALAELDRTWLPVENSWRLNERHYGALQGLNKAEMAAKFGEAQVLAWRRSYDTPPPALTPDDPRYEGRDRRYAGVEVPLTESLKDTVARTVPYWQSSITPALRAGKRVLVAWNASREAARAVSDALPLLAGADAVEIVAFAPGGDHGEPPAADIALYLARHGVKAIAARDVAPGIDIGARILTRAANADADLIVMGAYGHSRLRELALGGATRTLLEAMTVPVLMAH